MYVMRHGDGRIMRAPPATRITPPRMGLPSKPPLSPRLRGAVASARQTAPRVTPTC